MKKIFTMAELIAIGFGANAQQKLNLVLKLG